MRSRKPFQIGKLLDGSEASRLLSRARALGELDALVHELIPAPVNAHCRVMSVRDGTLVVSADSAAWAARLRYQTSDLVRQLAGVSSMKLRAVQVRVRAAQQLSASQLAPLRQSLSEKNSMTLRQAASSVTDADLKAALLRLAGGQRRQDGDG